MKWLFLLAVLPGCTCRSTTTVQAKPDPVPSASASASASVAVVDAALPDPTECTVAIAKKQQISAPGASATEVSIAMNEGSARVVFYVHYRAGAPSGWLSAELAKPSVHQETHARLALAFPTGGSVVTARARGVQLDFVNGASESTAFRLPNVIEDFALAVHEGHWLALSVGAEVSCDAEACVVDKGTRETGEILEDGRRGYVAVALSESTTSHRLYDKKCQGELPPKSHYIRPPSESGYCRDEYEHRPLRPSIALNEKDALATYELDNALWMQVLTPKGAPRGGRRKLIASPRAAAVVVANGNDFDALVAHGESDLSLVSIKNEEPAPAVRIASGSEPAMVNTKLGRVFAFTSTDGTLEFAWTKGPPTSTVTAIGKLARKPSLAFDGRSGYLAWLEADSLDAGASAKVVVAPIECR